MGFVKAGKAASKQITVPEEKEAVKKSTKTIAQDAAKVIMAQGEAVKATKKPDDRAALLGARAARNARMKGTWLASVRGAELSGGS